jgi:SAM-dependent MidA family methyltransferase
MTPLLSPLIARIQREGPITFADFMESALYDPEHGYYSSGRAQIGSRGDFHTAVSVGPLFGALLARQFVEMWQRLGSPSDWALVEQGAFDGQLAADVLSALAEFAPDCFESTTLRLVEPFEALCDRQRKTLSNFQQKVEWFSRIQDLPCFAGVHFSNELLDAFPVHRLRLTAEGWREMRVGADGNILRWVETAITDPGVLRAAQRLLPREPGALAEVCSGYAPLLETVAGKLQCGWLLALDYGMSEAELALPIRRDGTLSAYKEQRRQPGLLDLPGHQDLTAQVNFSEFARHAISSGWTLEGYAEQHRFFTGLAPLHFKDATAPPSRQEQRNLLAFRTLTHPQLMGFQFKAFCLGRQLKHDPSCGSGEASKRAKHLSGFKYAHNPGRTLLENRGHPPD